MCFENTITLCNGKFNRSFMKKNITNADIRKKSNSNKDEHEVLLFRSNQYNSINEKAKP